MTTHVFAMVVAALLVAPGLARAHEFKVLVYTEALGLPHTSTPAGVAAVQALAAVNGFLVDTAADSAAFTDANLAQYAAVIWLSTTGECSSRPSRRPSSATSRPVAATSGSMPRPTPS